MPCGCPLEVMRPFKKVRASSGTKSSALSVRSSRRSDRNTTTSYVGNSNPFGNFTAWARLLRGSSEAQRLVREHIAEGLRDLLSSEFGIAPYDIDSASSNIGLMTASSPARLTDAVVIYDAVYGSLRLTEPLYDAFRKYLARLGRGASLAGKEAIVSDAVAEHLCAWRSPLRRPEL